MKTLFLCNGDPFTESMLYKENYYIRACVENGDEVLVLASTYTYKDGKLAYADECKCYVNGYCLKREKSDHIINTYISNKIRKNKSFCNEVFDFKPDAIFVNTVQTYNINYFSKIVKRFPNIKIYGNFSVTFSNSGRNWISMNVLHRVIYKRWINKNLKYFEKLYYVTDETLTFLQQVYGIDEKKLQFLPLPSEVVTKNIREENKQLIRSKYNISNSTIVFTHSGKFNRFKKTREIIESFKKANRNDAVLILAGCFEDETDNDILEEIQSDPRIIFTGFVTGDELVKILCATDLYLQIGSVSQTAQTAIGSGCPVVLTHDYNRFVFDNGYIIDKDEELVDIIKDFSFEKSEQMSKAAMEVADRLINYKNLAKVIFS